MLLFEKSPSPQEYMGPGKVPLSEVAEPDATWCNLLSVLRGQDGWPFLQKNHTKLTFILPRRMGHRRRVEARQVRIPAITQAVAVLPAALEVPQRSRVLPPAGKGLWIHPLSLDSWTSPARYSVTSVL